MRRPWKIWCWSRGIIALAVLSVVIFAKVIWWLAWIGAATVAIMFIWIAYNAWRIGNRMKERKDDE